MNNLLATEQMVPKYAGFVQHPDASPFPCRAAAQFNHALQRGFGISIVLWPIGPAVAIGSLTAPVSYLSIMRTVFVFLSIGVVALAGCIGPSSGRQHVFQLKESPKMLTEELAIEKARETFAKKGYNLEQWQITRAHNPPSNAPDGTPDKYFDRFDFRPTEGRVHFTNGMRYKTVQVRLEGDRLVCFMFYGV